MGTIKPGENNVRCGQCQASWMGLMLDFQGTQPYIPCDFAQGVGPA